MNVLTECPSIKWDEKKEEEVNEENYYRAERCTGLLSVVELPREVQTDKAKASFKNAVLEVGRS